MTSNSLKWNEEHDIPSQILKTILYCMPQLFLDINMSGFCYICMLVDPKLLRSIGRTNCLYYTTRVDLYSHQILLNTMCMLTHCDFDAEILSFI